MCPSSREPPLTFEKDVRPILREYCLDCHGRAKSWKQTLTCDSCALSPRAATRVLPSPPSNHKRVLLLKMMASVTCRQVMHACRKKRSTSFVVGLPTDIARPDPNPRVYRQVYRSIRRQVAIITGKALVFGWPGRHQRRYGIRQDG